jgi:hypothetical protein
LSVYEVLVLVRTNTRPSAVIGAPTLKPSDTRQRSVSGGRSSEPPLAK